MPHTIYCWRCKADRPMLTAAEWELIRPHLESHLEQFKRYCREHTSGPAEAVATGFSSEALALYEALTDFKETKPLALYHHCLDLFGPQCPQCGNHLRTPQARFCAMCSYERPIGVEAAGGSEA